MYVHWVLCERYGVVTLGFDTIVCALYRYVYIHTAIDRVCTFINDTM